MVDFGLMTPEVGSRVRVYFPHEHLIPDDPVLNMRWRQEWFRTTSVSAQRALRKRCAEDLLFWIKGFVYLFDAGDETGRPGPVPFIPHPFQRECLAMMWAALHDFRCPLREKKPRRMGATWRMVALFSHCWQFMDHRHLLIGSHREEEVDSPAASSKGGLFVGEWSKLLPKFDFVHIHQPQWLLPRGYKPRVEPYRTRMRIVNPENGSVLWGTSAASRAGHGERGYACWWDEASRTENLYEIIGGLNAFSPARFWISTIGNLDHPFSTMLKDAPGVMQLNTEWWMHPEYSSGMRIDAETGRRSSPWLEKKLAEINNDVVLANQLYFADETQQIGGYYGPGTFQKMVGTADKPGTVMDPVMVGELDIVDGLDGPRVVRFVSQVGGRWRLWFHPDASGRPPRNTRYVAGIDTAVGTQGTDGRGASNSVMAVADWRTGEIVAEFVTSAEQPHDFARIVAAAGLWFEGDDFSGCCLVPESNGPGGQLLDCLVRKYRYLNLWKSDVRKDHYGWHRDGREENGRLAFGLHQEMICDGRFKERSMDCVREMRHYQHNPNGKGAPLHSASLMTDDPSGARDNHGDRTITRVCICQAMKRPYKTLPKAGEAPWGSYRWAKQRDRRSAVGIELP